MPDQDTAREQYFDSWDDYQHFVSELAGNELLQSFEQAADAVVAGDTVTLTALLRQHPELIQMRSPRNHHATLLHYVGANGFEQWRQVTPQNAAEVATLLLEAGAEVDAWGDMYGGATTLGLVATSVHPVNAGVQEAIIDVLLRYGADLNHGVAPDYTNGLLILSCIHNGRKEIIHYLARHGAIVDIEGAGALGDLDKVKTFYPAATPEKQAATLMWACQYGHLPVVDYLFEQGLDVHVATNGMTPLLSAAFGGNLELVKQLLDKGASMETRNGYGGTALGQTLWCLYNNKQPDHLAIMELLISKGAAIENEWLPYIEEQRRLPH